MQAQEQTEKEVVVYQAEQPVGSIATFSALLNRPDILRSVSSVIPRHLRPERILKMLLVATNRQPMLLQCTQRSLIQASMTAAQLGIDASGVLGRGYLVPYKNKHTGATEAQFIIGYLGLVDLARRGGDVQNVTARVVHKQDSFKLELGLNEVLEHKPNLAVQKTEADITGAYMIARFKSGGQHVEYMSRKEIEAIRARSKASDTGPWKTDFSEMCRKTVTRRGCKYLPLSAEVLGAIGQADDDLEEPIEMTSVVELQPTEGRVKWQAEKAPKLEETQQPAISFDPKPDPSSEEGPKASVAPAVISDDDRKALSDALGKCLDKKGVKASPRRLAAYAEMFKIAGANKLEDITSLDQYTAAMEWVAEAWGD